MKKIVLVVVVALLTIVVWLSPTVLAYTLSQPDSRNLRQLLSTLDTRMQSEGLLLSVSLTIPLLDGTRDFTLGYGYDDINLFIHEIGDDFFCLREIKGAAETITCIPFSNVASIFFINN